MTSVVNAALPDLTNFKLLKEDTKRLSELTDANNFCVYLPPPNSKNRNIADTEWEAEPFCLGSTPTALKAKANPMPEGFILSAHFVATDDYIQVTGQIDPAKANLNVTDEGGQMDVRAPNPSRCAGWKYYVNLIEPLGRTYCMRCCNDDRTCNRGISEKGCAHIIPGDYSGPLNGVGGGSGNGGSGNGGAIVTSSKTITSNPAASTPAKGSKATTTTTTPVQSTTPSTNNTPNNSNNNNKDNVPNDTTVSAQSVSAATTLTSSMTLFTILAIVLSFLSL
ncbi:hypothetical protein BJ944DRAFT_160607 [Cunninghamella echinulata]|nr:hypothetical protein BJ944DRAFT_160607 [Cunninghamella echinulata]